MKKFRAVLKNKSNWGSLITLALILACSVFSFWDTKFSEQARSAAFALVAVEFFLMLVVHLEEVKGAIGKIGDGGSEGTRLRKWEDGKTNALITGAKEELFFCGYDLSRLLHHRIPILEASNKVKRIRLLASDIDDKAVCEQFTATYGRTPSLGTISHLKHFSSNRNIEIRTISFPMILHVSAKDIHTTAGKMQVGF